MRRLRLPSARIAQVGGGPLPLLAEEAHYLVTVLRLAAGAELEVFDGEGGRYRARLLLEGEVPALVLGPRLSESAAPALDAVLVQALAKADKFELVLQKATELGARAIWPLAAARCVVKLEGERAPARAARWQKIAQEAARQCGRADVPQVCAPLSWPELLARLASEPDRVAALLDPDPAAPRLTQVTASAQRVAVLVGPEGGFTDEERAAARAAGVRPAALGPWVLRTETAGLAALSVLQHAAGLLG